MCGFSSLPFLLLLLQFPVIHLTYFASYVTPLPSSYLITLVQDGLAFP